MDENKFSMTFQYISDMLEEDVSVRNEQQETDTKLWQWFLFTHYYWIEHRESVANYVPKSF